MNKRITIKDIAREAGVSTATVSYIINDRKDQNISEETKNKVLQVINLFNYKPNVIAKSLRSFNDVKYIAIYFNDSNKILYQAEILRFCEILSKRFETSNFELVIPKKDYKKLDNVDAILSLNNTKDDFHQIGILNFIPLIAIDTIIDDDIFFSVTTDYAKLKEIGDEKFKDNYCFICLKPKDDEICEEILKIFEKVQFIEGVADLQNINSNNIFTINKTINDIIIANFPDKEVFFHREFAHRKCDVIVKCIQQSLSHIKYDQHKFKV